MDPSCPERPALYHMDNEQGRPHAGSRLDDKAVDLALYRMVFRQEHNLRFTLLPVNTRKDRNPLQMDPWRRKVWRGTIGMEVDGTVYIVVTVAPSRTRRHPHREHIVFWVRNLGNVSKGKKLKIPRDDNGFHKRRKSEAPAADKKISARKTGATKKGSQNWQ